jgi:hypothetical protein
VVFDKFELARRFCVGRCVSAAFLVGGGRG